MYRLSFSPSLKRLYDRIPKFKVAAICAPLLILAFAIYSFAPNNSSIPTSPSKSFANVTIKNFGQMDNHFYRGAQPKEEEYKELADLGVKTIIDLRDDPLPYANKAAEAAHMHYFNIPMSDKDYPKDESIEKFLNITKQEGNWPFYVHCAGGRHRSGVMGAMYRFNYDGWNYDRAYEEMKNYDFYTRFGHGALKKYVEDYWQRLQTKGAHPSSAPVSGQTHYLLTPSFPSRIYFCSCPILNCGGMAIGAFWLERRIRNNG